MSERWQALMAMSASNTEKTKSEVETALAQRKEKEAQARKQRAEAEKKQQELEKQMRLKHFEHMQKEAERKKKEEEIKKAREAQVERQIAEAGIAALYGKKKAKTTKPAGKDANGVEWPSRSGQKSEGKRQRTTDDYDEPTGFEFLTREEKRQRKQQAEMAKLMGNSKKSGSSSRYGKVGSKLRGGAVDMAGPAGSAGAGGDSSKSIRQRLTAMPNTLMKLNTVKRDTRTIDEIIQDRQKEKEKKTLDGDEARGFDDWFGDKKDKIKKSSAPPTTMGSAAGSGANTPNSPRSTPQPSSLSNVKRSSIPPRHSSAQPRLPPAKGTSGSSNLKTSSSLSKPKAGSQPLPSFSKNGKSSASAAAPTKKRPRSPTPESDLFSDEDEYDDYDDVRYSKKRGGGGGGSGIDIWAIMGMDKKKYTSRDYNSDDDDMEADAVALEKEEKMSMKIARKEDQEALEAEKRHEEEKRRRKKERERAGRAY